VGNIDPKYLEVYAHSHGANVVMLSTHEGLPVHKLVMLSPPVRNDYFADWNLVEEAYNIQAAFDPVVGIARGGQWFNLPGKVKEKKLNARSHSASHDPRTWEDNGVPAFVGLISAGLP
jgi:alpha-beta hydrolase superfamily lysophospholipase